MISPKKARAFLMNCTLRSCEMCRQKSKCIETMNDISRLIGHLDQLNRERTKKPKEET